MRDEGLRLYLNEIGKHKQNYKFELDELHHDLLASQLTSRDYRAAERLLQVFTELCIGLSKHWVKQIQGHSSSDAYQAFVILKEHGKIDSERLSTWKKIIGMRNGLVHDYLNIDLLIIEKVIKEQHYLELEAFSTLAIQTLEQEY
ncbi:MAG: type VII toxin-antitoxin system HepT family RNase toxin [Vibrio sp.]